MAGGRTLALAPLYLRYLYERLDECVQCIVRTIGSYYVVSYADARFLQIFIWERFKTLTPQPNEFSSFEKVVDLKPRGLRWLNIRMTTTKTVMKEIVH